MRNDFAIKIITSLISIATFVTRTAHALAIKSKWEPVSFKICLLQKREPRMTEIDIRQLRFGS